METQNPTTALPPPLESSPIPLLAKLPNPPGLASCPRRARWQLDLMLMALESLDLTAAEAMLQIVKDLNLTVMIPNRVVFWLLRSTNPFRNLAQRLPMPLDEGKVLAMIVCDLARRQTANLRHLVFVIPQIEQQNLDYAAYAPLAEYLDRFRRNFRKRMNLNRSSLLIYRDTAKLDELAIKLLPQLLFCTGTAGLERLWFSLFDGEIEA
ncbi:DUF3038 domain-containing protein [Thermosynechococcaceae cyanobacterium BACA0444]|uniref:DUF3038 domain-containing protein n=1 Tax=Pseudocalidococcus azoricus BACA0444 TaxID=2918990 RepID=A0AAE4JUC8_9CYAN|nr:DUF3038 domain-containing protein [Pseudocalidococcus azoricus]MDS3859230.1 DUF3038 domain-containing protein [Pseudocalidococcus azoricus BACA0444]